MTGGLFDRFADEIGGDPAAGAATRVRDRASGASLDDAARAEWLATDIDRISDVLFGSLFDESKGR